MGRWEREPGALRLLVVSYRKRRRRQAQFLLALVTSVITLYASHPWASKDFTQWTPADIDRVLSDSPWAQQAMASFGKPLEPDDIPFTPPPGTSQNGMGGTRGVSDGRWDGGIARNTGIGETPSLPVTVRWDSALPIRQALSRSKDDDAAAVSAAAATNYVITVIGLAPGNVQPGGSAGREAQDPAEIAHGFVVNTRLTPQGKQPLIPDDVRFDPKTGAVHLFFTRRDPITLRDKEVTLVTRFGSVTVRKKFRLKEMIYKGQLEL